MIQGCDVALKSGNPDQLKAQFLPQEMEARLGLNEPAEAIKTFEENKDLLIKQSELLGQAYYLIGLAYIRTWNNSSMAECYDKALK